MTHRPLRRAAWLAVATSAGLALALPALAQAARGGFDTPAPISGKDDAGSIRAVIAPNGRTAVLYERDVRIGGKYLEQWRLATGPNAGALGTAKTMTLGGKAHRYDDPAPLLFARGDGGLVLCVRTGPTQGCSVAPPTGSFGPVVDVHPGERGWTAAVRPDGSLLIVYSHSDEIAGGEITGTTVSTAVLSAGGTLGAERPLARASDEQAYNGAPDPVVADDGTVAIPALMPLSEKPVRIQVGVRLMAPGTDTFGPIVPVPGAVEEDNNVELTGGRQLTVSYAAPPASGPKNAPQVERVIALGPGTTFSVPSLLPTTTTKLPGVNGDLGSGRVFGYPVGLPGGGLFSITARSTTGKGDYDCLNPYAGEIAAGPLGTTAQPAQPLSTKGQVAVYPQAAALDDGTVIASWVDGAGEGTGQYRVEASVRPSGATTFSAGQRLPAIGSSTSHLLATGGNTAALFWTTLRKRKGHRDQRHTIMASRYTATGLRASQAALPKHPGTSCDD